jgi:Na+/H+ antiporter NhaD/arsenite permease-like protein
MRRKAVLTAVVVVLVAFLSKSAGLNGNQSVASTVFAFMISGILMFWEFRLAFAFVGIFIMFALGVLDLEHFVEFAGLDVIFFLVGTMIVIGYLEEKHFLEHITEGIMDRAGKSASRLIATLMVLSALFAALVGEVTSILFMTAAVEHVVAKHKLDPVPFIMMMVFATNIGSCATVIGNPIGVLIAMRAGLTFIDFLRWATPLSLAGLGTVIVISLRYFSRDVGRLDKAIKSSTPEHAKAGGNPAVISRRDLTVCWTLFVGMLSLLVLHSEIERLLNIEKDLMLLATALGAGGVVLFIERGRARELFSRRVDWWTLSFFTLLFASVGTLRYVGVTDVLANLFSSSSLRGEVQMLAVISWSIGFLSSVLDNVLAVATFIPIIHGLASLGMYTFPMWWGILAAGTFMGNMTVVGSTANIVAAGIVEREKLGHMTFSRWIKPGILASIPPTAIALLMLYLQLPLMPR